MKAKSMLIGLTIVGLLISACAGLSPQFSPMSAPTPSPIPPTPVPTLDVDAQNTGDANPTAVLLPTPLPGNLDQVTFFEDEQEYTIQSLLPRDGIRPIYEPLFTTADEATLSPDELVMGVEINGDARAYAVGILRSREMVNDEVGGTPVLVTW